MRFLFEFLYLLAAVLFIVGLKFLSSPAHARRGNTTAALGMVVATLTLLASMLANPEGGPPHNLGLIVAAIAIGAVAGAVGARRVAMTDMPQMVAILNGCGGGSAALISTAEFLHMNAARAGADTMFGTIIGSISLSGSVVAFAKLQGLVSEKAINSPVQKAVNALLFLGLLGLVGMLGFSGGGAPAFYALLGVSLAFGVLMVMPIGGADMPVVISLLNSFTTFWSGELIAFSLTSPWSFANATTLPENEIEPMMQPNIVSAPARAWLMCRNSAVEMSAAEPPPQPFRIATICGMSVMATRRAATAPATAPIAMAAAIRPRLCGGPPSGFSIMPASSVTVATTMPRAAVVLPRRACAGEDRNLRPTMNSTAASR